MEFSGNVTLLTAKNWETWKTDIKVLLMHHGAWEFIGDGKTESNNEVPAGKETDKLTWREQNDIKLRKARSYTLIYQTLTPEFKPLISHTTEGSEAWRILKEHFEPTTRARVIQLLGDFFDLRYAPDENLGLFLCRIKQAAERLREVGHSLQPLYMGYQMIRSLPEEFQSTVQAIYRWTDNDFVPDKIETELLLEENRLKLSKKDFMNSSVNAFSGEVTKRKTGKFLKSKYSSKAAGPCYFCKSYGHVIANCKVKNKSKSKETSNVEIKSKFVNSKSNFKNDCISSKSNFEDSKSKFLNCKRNFDNSSVKCTFSEQECSLIEISPSFEANSSDLGQSASWVFDTAATAHFCNNKNLFLDFEPVTNMQMSLAVGEKESPVQGKGIINFFVKCKDGQYNQIILKDVYYNPNLRRNLLSGTKLESLGINFVGSKGKIYVYDKEWNKLFFAYRKDGLYFLKPSKYKTKCKGEGNSVNISANSAEKFNANVLWHERFCHINSEYLINTSKNGSVKGLPELFKLAEDCISCKLAKSKRISFKSIGKIRSRSALELLHMDLCGPLPVLSHGGSRYFFTIIDDFSRKVAVFAIRNKSDVFQIFSRFQKRAERYLNKKIISIRTDGGLEFCNREFENFLDKQGIAHEKTNTYSPEMNGVAERYNFTALDGVKTLLNASGLSQKFWAEALSCFTYVWNRVSHKHNNKTPFELYSGNKPSVSHLKRFGCLAYVGVPKQIRRKLDMRAKLGIMCGYAQTTKGYRIWLLEEHKIVETINVRFDETKLGIKSVSKFRGVNFSVFDFPDDGNIFEDDEIPSENSEENREKQSSESCIDLTPCTSIEWVRKVVPRKEGPRKDIYYGIEGTNTRIRSFNELTKYCEQNKIECDKNLFNFSSNNSQTGKISNFLNEVNLIEVKIPSTFRQAIKTPESSKWRDAMNQEMNVMYERKVWDLVKPPKDAKILGNRWVYTLKQNEKNEIVRYKARLVAQGFNQIKGESYDEVFSPVVSFSIIRLFFAIFSCFFKWLNVQVDVNNAYLYADLEETVYMYQPEGYIKESDKVCKLNRALYGLHQSSRQWYFEVDDVLLKLNFSRLEWCNCVYMFKTKLILLLYVDDIVLFGKTKDDLDFGMDLLQKHFNLKFLGGTKKLLGIEFEEIDDKLFIHQTSYIEKVCDMFSSFDIPISSLPMPRGLVLSKSDSPSVKEEIDFMSKIPYRNLIGCLSFIASRTRPDIMYAVNLLSQFQSNPGIRHWNSLLKLLGYLKYTKNYKLELSRVKALNILCFSDSDFAANRDDRVSMGGYILFLDETPISWKTFKQKCVSLSTMEAEYVSLTEAAKELIWIKNVLQNEMLKLNLKESILYCDNQAAIAFSNSPFENQKTKHIHVKYHFLRNLVLDKLFKLKYIQSKLNLADSFTKPQVKEQLMKFCMRIFEI